MKFSTPVVHTKQVLFAVISKIVGNKAALYNTITFNDKTHRICEP